MGVKYKLNYFR